MELKDTVHQITLAEAIEYTANYRANFDNKFDPSLNQAKGFSYSKEAIEDLLAQEGAVGIRIYGGQLNEASDKISNTHFANVLVAIDVNGNDILTTNQEVIKELGKPCPHYCDNNNSPLANN